MSENQKPCFGFMLAVIFLISCCKMAGADTLSYTTGGVKVVENDVIITVQSGERTDYLKIGEEGWVEKGVVVLSEHTKDLKTTKSSPEEKKRILENWKQRTSSAIVARDFGPSFTIAAFGTRYPLPENVRYFMGRPRIMEGPEFYVGKDSANASKVYFKEVQSAEILKNGTAVRILWRNSESSEGDLLPSWKYGDHMGAPAVLFGMNMDTLSYVELPLKSVRKITVTGYKALSCSGSPSHSFAEPPSSWKFCPICGKPFVAKE